MSTPIHPIPESHPMARFFMAVNVCFSRIYHRLEVRSPCRLPRTGPAIVVCNHISGLDPALIQSVCPRVIIWMMASEYYQTPGMGWFFRRLGAIPVDRSGRDFAATRQALRALEAGRVVGIFPEGRIASDHRLLEFQTGVAMLAMKTGVEVYPAAIEGSQRDQPMLRAYLTRQTARIAFGPGISLKASRSGPEALETATATIRRKIQDLRQDLGGAPLGSEQKER